MGKCINPETNHGYAWKGDNISYRRLHTWLRETYGRSDQCDSPKCDHTSATFHYALKKGCPYRRDRGNFIRLCAKCHSSYDNHGEKVRKSLTGHTVSEETRRRIGRANSRKVWTKEERLKLSIAQKKRHAQSRIDTKA